jgi:hypothetical protein
METSEGGTAHGKMLFPTFMLLMAEISTSFFLAPADGSEDPTGPTGHCQAAAEDLP